MNKEFYDKYQKDLDCGSCAGLINCVNDTTPQCLLGTSFYLEDLVDQLQHQLDQQKAMWNELKEWVEEIKLWNEKQMKEARLNLDYYIRAKSQNVFINKMLDKMQELGGEDVED